jgi:Dephospho-CoA kinase
MGARKLCIGLTGRMASGKGEVARMLRERGFSYISLSDIVRREAAREGGTVDRSRMQDIGNRLRAQGGAGVLGRRVREEVAAAVEARWVIDGIRNPAEVLELRRIDAFILIGVECSVPTILARMKARGRASDAGAERELRAALDREWGLGEPANGQQVGPALALADFSIDNNGTLAGLRDRLDAVLEKIGAGHE